MAYMNKKKKPMKKNKSMSSKMSTNKGREMKKKVLMSKK